MFLKHPPGLKRSFANGKDISPIFFGTLSGLLIFIVVLAGLILESQLYHKENDLKAYQKLSIVKAKLENELNSRLTLSQGLVSYVKLNPNLNERQFSHFVKHLIGNDRLIRNITLLKGTTIIYAYPYETNKGAIGTDLMNISAQRNSLIRAIKTKKPVITGIVNLVQGGHGIIFRVPIFLDSEDAAGSNDEFWGLASIVLNADELFNVTAIEDTSSGFIIGLRSLDENTVEGGIIYGDAKIFQDKVFDVDVLLSSGKWQLAAAKKECNSPIGLRMLILLVFGVALTLLSSVFVGYMVHLRNIMKNMAITDTLTKLPNRALLVDNFMYNMSQAQQNGTKFGVLMLDIDKFKVINDTYGHIIGDHLLKAFSERLKSLLRASDTVIRMGGDEFLLLIAGAKSREDILHLVDKIHIALNEPFIIEDNEISAGTSIGYSIYPDDDTDMNALMTKADNAMYEEKKSKTASY